MKIRLLCTESDRESLQPILDALHKKGVHAAESAGVTLCALSEHFYADAPCVEALLSLIGKDAAVLPLQLDGAPIPDEVKNALYARNILFAEGRDAELLSERIVDALPKKESRLPLYLTLAGIAAAAVIGLLIWNGTKKPAETALPVMASAGDVYIPAGLTAEDLSQVRCAVIVGEHVALYTDEEKEPREDGATGWRDMIYELASAEPHATSRDWYWHEDGSAVTPTAYDLRFLSLMPNLEELHLCAVEIAAAPDLSALGSLERVWLLECAAEDLTWLGSSQVREVRVECGGELDFSPLGNCPELRRVYLALHSNQSSDLSAFSPPALRELEIFCGFSPDGFDAMDLSGLAGCDELQSLTVNGGSLRDLSFLEGKEKLLFLTMDSIRGLRDVSALRSLKNLSMLRLSYCPDLRDFTPIAGCSSLYSLNIHCDGFSDNLTDASFLRDLPELIAVELFSCNLRDLDFLEGLADNGEPLRIGFAGEIEDYSGLAYVKEYEYLHVNPRRRWNDRSGDFAAVLPYIRDARIERLALYECVEVDLSTLPAGIKELYITGGDLTDLQGLPAYALRRLELNGCQYLRSLDGLEAVPTAYREGALTLVVNDCPRLTDYSALRGAFLEHLDLIGGYEVPALPGMRFHVLSLENTEGLTDLGFLVGLNGGNDYNIHLIGLTELSDLSPLWQLRADELWVPPQVAEQAEALVEAGNFECYEVVYPNSAWSPQDSEVELLSLDELSTLPAAMLRRVERLCLVGGTVVNTDRYSIEDDWDNAEEGVPGLLILDRETGEALEWTPGGLTDLSALSALPALRELELCAQPLERLDGVQSLSELVVLRLRCCGELRDMSAAFACPALEWLSVGFCPVESIEGVQNLWELKDLDIANTAVTDLTPLLSLTELERVCVTEWNMAAAVESLDGQEYAFELKTD